MNIEILEFERLKNPETSFLGHALISVNGKMKVWFSVFKNKHGNYFVAIPSVKIKGEFTPAFSFTDTATAKKLCIQIVEQMTSEGLLK